MELNDEFLAHLAKLYVSDKSKYNMSVLAKKYKIPYPTLRRKLTKYLERHRLDDLVREEFLPYDTFNFLKPGDTYQHDYRFTIWAVVGYKKIDGERVVVLRPTKKKGKRHWVGITLEDNNE